MFAVLLRLLEAPGNLCTRTELLDSVWGHRYVTPSTLNRIIALARRAFDDDAEAPRYIQTVHRAGYRFIGVLQEADAAEPLQMRFGPPSVARPPSRLDALIGREEALAQLGALLARGRAATLLGPGGMGKTQCALEFARLRADDYPDGVWFFDLAPLATAEAWLESLAATLSVRQVTDRERLDGIARVLAERRALLLLDNCDRIAAGVGALVHDLLRCTTSLQVLATSQQQLQFVGERVLRLPPLGLPAVRSPAGEAELQEFRAAPAVALLLARITAVQPAFTLAEQDAPAIADLCEQLDGMPLALELAAARFAVLSPQQVLERLAHRFAFLVSDMAGRDSRHRTLLALLEWSYALLSLEEQRLLAWLGVFVQGWSMDAVTGFAAAIGTEPRTLIEQLTGLVGKSLVIVDLGQSPPRYRLLESVRDFALVKLAGLGEESRARDAHLDQQCQMTRIAHLEMVGGGMQRRITLLMREHGNIEAAVDHAVGSAQRARGLGIVGSLALYFKAHGEFHLALRLCRKVLRDDWREESVAWGRALLTYGVVTVYWGGLRSDADEALREVIRVAGRSGDAWTQGYATGYHALWLVDAERLEEAEEEVRRTAGFASALDDALLRGHAGLVEGFLLIARQRLEDALAVLVRARPLGNDLHQQHFIEIYVSLTCFMLGAYARAAGSAESALRTALVVGHIRGIAGSIEIAAYLANRDGRHRDAARYLNVAARIRERTGAPLFRFWRAPHAAAEGEVRAALGEQGYEEVRVGSATEREEEVIKEVARRLRETAMIPVV